MRAIYFAISLLLVAAGCQTTPEDQQAAGVEDRSKPGFDVTKPQAREGAGALKDPSNILSKRTVYFDYDKFELKDEYRPLIEAHAKYLRENPSAKMLIQGNADERGSREYNVALGQKRSDTVKRVIVLLGAREAQVESVSLGEEKPACTEHNEDCWAKNRRGEMLYGGEY